MTWCTVGPVQPEDDIVQAAVSGDSKARDAVSSWLWSELHGFFANCFHDSDTIDELLQTTVLVVCSKLGSKAPRNAAQVLDFGVRVAVTNTKAARRKIAEQQARRARLAREPHGSPRSLSSTLRYVEWRDAFDRCIERLATPYRVVVRGLMADATVKSLAREEGVSIKTIYWRKDEAIRQLQAMMDAEGLLSPPIPRE